MKPKKKKAQPKFEHYTIVGMQYRLTKQARSMLAKHVPYSVVFERDHKNEYDENAIAVFIADNQLMEGMHVGYLRKEVAGVLAPKLDQGLITLPPFGVVDAMNVDKGTAEVKMAISSQKLAS